MVHRGFTHEAFKTSRAGFKSVKLLWRVLNRSKHFVLIEVLPLKQSMFFIAAVFLMAAFNRSSICRYPSSGAKCVAKLCWSKESYCILNNIVYKIYNIFQEYSPTQSCLHRLQHESITWAIKCISALQSMLLDSNRAGGWGFNSYDNTKSREISPNIDTTRKRKKKGV